MLTFNDAKQFNWNIKYQVYKDLTDEIETIIEGRYYDFIPRHHDMIALNNNVYLVNGVLYDFDTSTILVTLRLTKELEKLN